MPHLQRITAALSNKLLQCSLIVRVLLAFCLLCSSLAVTAAEKDILLIHDGKSDIAQEVTETLTQQLASMPVRIDLLDLSRQTIPDNNVLQDYSTIITLGTEPAELAMDRNPPTPILCLFVSSQTWSLLIKQRSSYSRSAILLDQPINRQLNMIQEIFGPESKIGTILGPYSSSLAADLDSVAKQQQQTLHIKTIQTPDELIPALNELTEKVDLLLAEPDSVVYNKRSIQGILLLTYRSKTPVIGFSQAYSRAGAMVSLYSSTENITRQVAEIIPEQVAGNHTYFPKYFSITFNRQVARTLGLSPPNEKELIERIKQKESSHK